MLLVLDRRLAEQGVDVTILDIDERFAGVPSYCRFDIHRPKWLGRAFGVIDCDLLCFSISLTRLFAVVRILSRNDFGQALLTSYLSRRSVAIMGTFAPFGQAPTGYQMVQKLTYDDVELFANVGENSA